MRKLIDINTWSRKEHYEFFSTFEEPFYGITVDVDCTHAYGRSKELGRSFFSTYLYASLKAANSVDAFRYRIIDNEVYDYDVIHASPTIARKDGTFGFSYIDFHNDLETFDRGVQSEVDRVQSTAGLGEPASKINVIFYSSLPWLKFTSLSHARRFSVGGSCPMISFGKMTEANGKRSMPMSVHVHHALVDGSHVGEYVDAFQRCLNGGD